MNIESATQPLKRQLFDELLQKLQKGISFLLLGPRQTGKSTLIESLFAAIPESQQLRYYLQRPHQREILENDPETLLREVEAKLQNKTKPRPIFVFIDEIQKIPKLFDELQFLIDKKKIILAGCGSSARQMRRYKTNWLPGRVHLEHLYPLTESEIKTSRASHSLENILLYGTLPAIFLEKDLAKKNDDLAAYTHLYLEEEIRSEAVTRNLPRFTQFLRLAALESGTSPNYSKIGQTVGAAPTTIAEYYQILEDTLIVHSLPAYGKGRDQVIKSPKYYFFDVGVRNAAAGLPLSPGILQLQRGVLIEHFVILEAFAHFSAKNRLSYFRTKAGQEVDLIIENHKKTIAVEIKATARPSAKDFQGLQSFSAKHKTDASFLVCQIGKAQKFGKHLALSTKDFIEKVQDVLG